MRLELDLGNSRLKWRLVLEGERVAGGAFTVSESPEEVAAAVFAEVSHCAQMPIQRVLLAAVGRSAVAEAVAQKVRHDWGLTLEFAEVRTPWAGVEVAYAEPGALGVDRWLALLAARAQYAGELLVIDAGSALTLDLLSADGTHRGGYIAPGLERMRTSLWQGTEAVRVLAPSWSEVPLTPGRDTAGCVHSALLQAALGLIERVSRQTVNITGVSPGCVLTGGDADVLARHLPEALRCPELVLDGLILALPDAAP
ncbi:type III pantothenate kinase [Marinimicrobium alkaliphilum]|uniref:type III pantothenate kinase n=1 Tax=Marinimicrobium alkaliphilum TaxID=2202654 RepID=UPI000DBAAEDD|nr:type III pantothenate kinase [Marinimicrobium alkaliphilum]